MAAEFKMILFFDVGLLRTSGSKPGCGFLVHAPERIRKRENIIN
jgi:hypothetical protein